MNVDTSTSHSPKEEDQQEQHQTAAAVAEDLTEVVVVTGPAEAKPSTGAAVVIPTPVETSPGEFDPLPTPPPPPADLLSDDDDDDDNDDGGDHASHELGGSVLEPVTVPVAESAEEVEKKEKTTDCGGLHADGSLTPQAVQETDPVGGAGGGGPALADDGGSLSPVKGGNPVQETDPVGGTSTQETGDDSGNPVQDTGSAATPLGGDGALSASAPHVDQVNDDGGVGHVVMRVDEDGPGEEDMEAYFDKVAASPDVSAKADVEEDDDPSTPVKAPPNCSPPRSKKPKPSSEQDGDPSRKAFFFTYTEGGVPHLKFRVDVFDRAQQGGQEFLAAPSFSNWRSS